MNYYAECFKKFGELPEEMRQQFGAAEVVTLVEEIEQEYQVDLKFLVVLIAIGELRLQDIIAYLQQKYKLDEDAAEDIKTQLLDKVFYRVLDRSIATDDVAFEFASPTALKDIFANHLVDVLGGENNVIDDLNKSIFIAFAETENIQEELAKLLVENQELLTANFLMNGAKTEGSIANWLKDFIAENGSDIFSSIVLAKYLSNSKNILTLPEAEKKLVRRLLKTYRNLAFFPESMENIPLEDWEIIPIERSSQVIRKVDTSISSLIKRYPAESLEHKALEEEMKNNRL